MSRSDDDDQAELFANLVKKLFDAISATSTAQQLATPECLPGNDDPRLYRLKRLYPVETQESPNPESKRSEPLNPESVYCCHDTNSGNLEHTLTSIRTKIQD